MTFFYDLNKRLAQLADKQDAQHLAEHSAAVPQTPKKGSLAQALNERDLGKHNNATTGFAALAKKAGKEYGSKAAGERVAGAVLNKLRHPKEGVEEAVRGLYYGDQGYQPPTTQAQRDATAKDVKQTRAKNRADTRVTGYGNRVEPQRGPESASGLARRTQPSYGGQETPVDSEKTHPYYSNPKHLDNYGNLQIKPGQGKGVAKEGQLNELSPELLKRARDKAGEKWSAADDRKDKKASAKHNAQDDKFNSALRKKQKQDTNEDQINELSPELLKRARDKAGMKYAQADDRRDQKASDKYNAQDDKFNSALRKKQKGMAEADMEEGNAFSKAVVDAKRDGIQKGEKIRVGGKELPLKELDMRLLKGMQGSMKASNTDSESERNRHKKYGYRSDRDDTGNDDDYDEYGNLKNKKKAAVSDGPKKKGRPTKEKQPERVTGKSYKYKDGRPTKTKEGLDSDGVMMTRPSNMSSEGVSPAEQGEYNDEAGMTKDSLHTIVRNARELEKCLRDNENLPEWVQEKVGQIKGMMTSVTDYILSTHERDAEQHMGRRGITVIPENANFSGSEVQQAYRLAVMLKNLVADPDGKKVAADLIKLLRYKLQQSNDTLGPANTIEEKAVSQAQRRAAGIAHAAQKGEMPKSKLRGASKEMAKMPQGELHKFAATKEKGLPKKVKKTDEGNDGNLANNAKPYDKVTQGDVVAGRLGKDEQGGKDKKAKEKKVDETTVAGSVATAAPSGKSGKGMQFGKGVYESLDRQFKQALTESISIESKMQECGDGNMEPGITIQADGEDAAKLMMLLKLAGLDNQIPKPCPSCGASPCGCAEVVDENSPDWPTNTDTLAADPNLRTYSGGLNGPKSTGQTTIPVVASQLRRQASMEESIALERNLFKTWQNYKG